MKTKGIFMLVVAVMSLMLSLGSCWASFLGEKPEKPFFVSAGYTVRIDEKNNEAPFDFGFQPRLATEYMSSEKTSLSGPTIGFGWNVTSKITAGIEYTFGEMSEKVTGGWEQETTLYNAIDADGNSYQFPDILPAQRFGLGTIKIKSSPEVSIRYSVINKPIDVHIGVGLRYLTLEGQHFITFDTYSGPERVNFDSQIVGGELKPSAKIGVEFPLSKGIVWDVEYSYCPFKVETDFGTDHFVSTFDGSSLQTGIKLPF